MSKSDEITKNFDNDQNHAKWKTHLPKQLNSLASGNQRVLKDWNQNNYDTRSSRSNNDDRDNNLETSKLERSGNTEKAPKMVATNGDYTVMPY